MRQEPVALGWIVDLLSGLGVPFQAVGGLAARAYGASRPLVDLDFYVPTARLTEIAAAAADFVVRPPAAYRDATWDLSFMKLEFAGCAIELGGAEDARFYDIEANRWREARVCFDRSETRLIFGIPVPTMPREQVLQYKRRLGRDVDLEDIDEIRRAHGPDVR
jgi:hypothetical protein